MRTIARIFVCAAVLGTVATHVPAQGITIDTSDIKAMFAVGMTTVYRSDTLTSSADIGRRGESSWDFSRLTISSRMRLMSVAVGTTPFYASDFPLATHALSDTAFTYSFTYEGIGQVTLKGTGYNYMTLGEDLLDFGLKGSGKAYLLGGSVPAEGQWVKSPSAIYFDLPLAMSKSWTTVFNEILSGSAELFGSPIKVGPDTTAHKITYTVDAYGPLSVPGFPPVNALRIRKVDSLSRGTTSSVRVSYMFLAKDGTSVQVMAADPASPDSGTIIIVPTSTQWTAATATYVEAIHNVPARFGLRQNYPNPFNPSTIIRFTLPVREHVTLKVYNLLGGEVATLVNETVEAGESSVQFDAGKLASGVYLYKLQAGNSTQTRRMILMK